MLCWHPTYGTFATAGSDGTYSFWDRDAKKRLKPSAKCSAPVSAGSYSFDGNYFGYAVSYDWSKGQEAFKPSSQKNQMFLHKMNMNEMKPEVTYRSGRR